MPEATEMPPLAYNYGFANPGNFPGWYTFYARSDGTSANPSNFDSLVRAFVEHLSMPENEKRTSLLPYNQNPDAFGPGQIAQIEMLVNEHNKKVSGLAAEVISE